MLTPAALDEASSMGTMESDSLLPPSTMNSNNNNHFLGNHGMDDVSISEASLTHEEEDDWRIVTGSFIETASLHGSDSQLSHNSDNHNTYSIKDSGVLILAGEEALHEEAAVASTDNGVLNLSLGADSVPTVVGSIDGLAAGADKPKVSASTQTCPFSNEKLSDDSDDAAVTTSRTEKIQKTAAPREVPAAFVFTTSTNKSRLALFLVPTVALFLVPGIASLHLYREKHSLLESVAKLEQEVREKSSMLASVQEEVLTLKDEAAKKKREEALRWDTCGEAYKQQETILVDNCWLSAKANVRLGNCANDAKEKAVQLSTSLLERLEQLGNTSYWIDPFAYDVGGSSSSHTTTMDDVGESVAKMIRRVDSLGKKLWEATIIKGPTISPLKGAGDRKDTNGSNFFHHPESHSFFSKMEVSGKSHWKETMNDVKSAFFTLFAPAENESWSSSSSSSASKSRNSNQPDSLDDVVRGITDIVAAAGSFSLAAGEALVVSAVEKATDVIDFNESYVDELLEIARQAFEEASLTHVADK